MKRIILILPLLASCEPEQPQANCECYKVYQEHDMGNWTTYNTESPQTQPCEIDNDTVYTDIYFRYIWKCN